MKKTSIVVLALSTFCLSGCGTVCNFTSGQPKVYGGVVHDLEFAMTPRERGGVSANAQSLMILWLLDLSLTSVADTATLPVTYLMQHQDVDSQTVPPVYGQEPTPVQELLRNRSWEDGTNREPLAVDQIKPGH